MTQRERRLIVLCVFLVFPAMGLMSHFALWDGHASKLLAVLASCLAGFVIPTLGIFKDAREDRKRREARFWAELQDRIESERAER